MIERIKFRVPQKTGEKIETLGVVPQKKLKGTIFSHYVFDLEARDDRWPLIRKTIVTDEPIHNLPEIVLAKFCHDTYSRAGFSEFDVLKHYWDFTEEDIKSLEYFRLAVPICTVLDREIADEDKIYLSDNQCKECRSGWRQITPLTFVSAKGWKKPFFRVYGRNEWIVNKTIKTYLRQLPNVPEDMFKDIYTVKGNLIENWYQLCLREIDILTPQTEFAHDAIFRNPKDTLACPKGHTMGLNVVSPVYVSPKNIKGDAVTFTKPVLGGKGAIEVPISMLIVSNDIYHLIRKTYTASDIYINPVVLV